MAKLDKYNQYRDKICTGDLFLFAGKGRTSSIIKRATHSKYSHVGIALWLTVPEILEKRLFIIESTTLNNTPDITGEYRKGVQIVLLSQRIEGYDGDVWWLSQKEPLTEQQEKEAIAWCLSKHAAKTQYDIAQAIAAGIDPEKWHWSIRWLAKPLLFWSNTKENMKLIFCSELATKFHQITGKVPCEVNPSESVPEDTAKYPFFLQPPILL